MLGAQSVEHNWRSPVLTMRPDVPASWLPSFSHQTLSAVSLCDLFGCIFRFRWRTSWPGSDSMSVRSSSSVSHPFISYQFMDDFIIFENWYEGQLAPAFDSFLGLWKRTLVSGIGCSLAPASCQGQPRWRAGPLPPQIILLPLNKMLVVNSPLGNSFEYYAPHYCHL